MTHPPITDQPHRLREAAEQATHQVAVQATTDALAPDELSDAMLEHVVGGLARAWFEQVDDFATLRHEEVTRGFSL